MALEVAKLSVDDLIAHYLKHNDINGAKPKRSGASSSAAKQDAVIEKKKATPVAPPGHNPNYDKNVHCKNCRTRKFKKDCCFKCCYNCCVYSEMTAAKRTECVAHTVEHERKIAEERYIEEAMDYEYGACKDENDPGGRTSSLYHKKKKLKQFVHAEDRFSDVNQTVVVWCLYDFGLFKKYSDDCFAFDVRLKRQKELARRRRAAGASSAAVRVRRPLKLTRKQRFDVWHAKVLADR